MAVTNLAKLPLVMTVGQAASIVGQGKSTAHRQIKQGTWIFQPALKATGPRMCVSRYIVEQILRGA